MVQVKHIFVPVMALPAAQMGAPQIMHLAPFFLAARDSRSAAISSLRLASLLFLLRRPQILQWKYR